MSKLSRSVTIETRPSVYYLLDDYPQPRRDMSESRSMPMMGSKLKLEIMTPNPGVGAVYRTPAG